MTQPDHTLPSTTSISYAGTDDEDGGTRPALDAKRLTLMYGSADESAEINLDSSAGRFGIVSERVVGSGLRIAWEPNAPEAVMISDDQGRAVMAVRAHPTDPDQRHVVFEWSRVESATLSAPNDEALSGHRLWNAGLKDVQWLALVQRSELIRTLRRQNSVHPRHDPRRYDFLDHYVAPLKECVAEVVASELVIHRGEGTTLQAAATALS